jgi:glycerophosphoryl diester phosphodiesterase
MMGIEEKMFMKPKIIAHRGASAAAPENTIAAFQLALDLQADGIELDVMLTADKQLVVIHDDTVDRTTNGSGRVADMTLEEIRALDAGEGEKVPTLSEVLDAFGGKLLINIELKNYTSIFDTLPVEVSKLIESYGLIENVLISSFNPFNISRVRRRIPDAKLGLITQPEQAQHWIWRFFEYDSLHPYFKDVDAILVSALHARNRKVNAWTVDDPKEIKRLVDLQVDGIITNDPKGAQEVLRS